jgi:hypothetical protein
MTGKLGKKVKVLWITSEEAASAAVASAIALAEGGGGGQHLASAARANEAEV